MTTSQPSTDLVTRTVSRGETARIERMDQPRPGTYWRLREEITGEEDGQILCDPLTAGTVLLLENVEYADGEAHVYTFAVHPTVPEDESYSIRFHADRFYHYWEHCPEGEQIRERELLALTRDLERTQALMLQPPPNAAPVGLLGYDPTAPAAEGRELATRESVRDATTYGERLKANAEAQTAWITKHSATIQRHAKAIGRFHLERARVGLAAANAQLEASRGVFRTVDNLRLYTGEDVQLTQLRDGDPAPADAPLTIYQERLALDEELLLHLEVGGLDHTHLDSVAEVLADDTVLSRLIPAPRGIVLCRFRGSMKEFIKATGENAASAAYANAHMNRESQLHMLLVRDGAKVYLVDGPDFLQQIQQLMPSAAEQIGLYTDHRGEEIRREDLAYARAQRDQIGALGDYAKVLIMLWGLRDRSEIFADWDVPAFASWLDWGFQDRYMHLVDQSTMLQVERPSYAAFREAQNRYLGPGAWVAVRVGAIFSYTTIPGAYSRHETRGYRGWDYDQLYRHNCDDVLIACVRSEKGELYVEVPLTYCAYSREPRRDITGKLYLARKGTHELLVLDRLHAEDLTYYLTSRKQRRAYNEYIQLFRAARSWVSARDAEEAPMREDLRRAVAEARVQHDPEVLEEAITAALAVARTARRDKRAPQPGSSGFAAYRKGALDTLHALLTDQAGRVAAVDTWCEAHARVPLRLTSVGTGEFKLYLEPGADEHDARLGEHRHATSASVAFDPSGAMTIGDRRRELLRPAASEHVVHDWLRPIEVPNERAGWPDQPKTRTIDMGVAHWLAKEAPFGPLRYEQAAQLMDMPARQSAWFQRGVDLQLVLKSALGSRASCVVRHALRFAVGILHVDGKPHILCAERDALGHCYITGDEAMKRACLDLIERRYAQPAPNQEELKNGTYPWALSYAALESVWPHRDAEHLMEMEAVRYTGKDHVVDPQGNAKANAQRRHQCVTLTPVGAELFPWLAARTRGAA